MTERDQLDELLLNSPYLRRIRREAFEEGFKESVLLIDRRCILDTVTFRFQLSLLESQQLEQQLLTINDESQLDKLFATALRSEKLEEFQTVLNHFLH